MEAANLGAYLSGHPDDALDEAMDLLGAAPSYSPDIGAWATAAFTVLERWPAGTVSVGIPTWFYGHEPPNAFATQIAKYFKNAIREDVLLHLCDAGIVFLPGRAGTVQEVFQDACENYYSDADALAPMVLVGADHRGVDRDRPVRAPALIAANCNAARICSRMPSRRPATMPVVDRRPGPEPLGQVSARRARPDPVEHPSKTSR